MSIFAYGDTVRVRDEAPVEIRPGNLASVYAVDEEADRWGDYLRKFPHGVVYGIEFEDGHSVEVPESLLEKGVFPGEMK